jgi:hypothetical protein
METANRLAKGFQPVANFQTPFAFRPSQSLTVVRSLRSILLLLCGFHVAISLGKPQYGLWIGYFEFLLVIPLIYLLVKAPELGCC